MALSGWSSSNYLERTTGDGMSGAPDILVSAWVFVPTGVTASGNIYSMSELDSSNDHGHRLTLVSDAVQSRSRNTTTTSATTSATVAKNAWVHVAGWLHNTPRAAFVAGGNRADNTNARTTNTPGFQRIGNIMLGADLLTSTVGVAEISLWGAAGLSTADMDALVALLATPVSGTAPSPLTVNAQTSEAWTGALISYLRLNDSSDVADLHGSRNFTLVGSLSTFGSHPPVEATSSNTPPATPTVNVGTITATTVALTSSAFDDADADGHASSDWVVVARGDGPTGTALGADGGASVLTAVTIDELPPATLLDAHVRHQDDSGAGNAWSAWSAAAPFETAADAQYARPDAVLENAGGWVTHAASSVAADILAAIATETRNDATYIEGQGSIKLRLSDIQNAAGVANRLAVSKNLAGGNQVDVLVELRSPDGTTVVESANYTNVTDAFVLQTMDLSLDTLSGQHQLWITASSP